MALLIAFWLVFVGFSPSSEAAYPAENVSKAVLFDTANSQNSVAVIGEQLFEYNDDFEHYQIIGFEPSRILLKDHLSEEVIKIPAEDALSRSMRIEARHRFVVRQLRAIYRAQTEYVAKYRDHYASNLDQLIKESFLSDGFAVGIKQDYQFWVDKTTAEFNQEPRFFVMAAPVHSIQPDLYFSVDELGSLRFGESAVELPWGPVWDYTEHLPPKSEYVGTESPEKLTENSVRKS